MICNVHCTNHVSTEYSLFLLLTSDLVVHLWTKLVHYIRKTPQTAAASIPSDHSGWHGIAPPLWHTYTYSLILCVCACSILHSFFSLTYTHTHIHTHTHTHTSLTHTLTHTHTYTQSYILLTHTLIHTLTQHTSYILKVTQDTHTYTHTAHTDYTYVQSERISEGPHDRCLDLPGCNHVETWVCMSVCRSDDRCGVTLINSVYGMTCINDCTSVWVLFVCMYVHKLCSISTVCLLIAACCIVIIGCCTTNHTHSPHRECTLRIVLITGHHIRYD